LKPHEIASIDADGAEGIFRRLIRVDEKDLTLKGLFDHFRNYLICAGVLSGALLVARHGALLSELFSVRLALAITLASIATVLAVFNLVHGLMLLSAWGVPRWLALVLGLLSLFVMGELFFSVGLRSV
jgi:hypothetical protein